MRNLSKTLAAISLLVPASANSLGIGDIKLHSSLNQKLNAEIALIVSASDNISNLDVRIASPEKFDEAGVPWSYFLSKIKVEAVVRGNTFAVVKLSSQEALREPFLDFLLEVSWDKGSLYREFTVLIDPPVAYDQPVIPVIQKVEPVVELEQAELKQEDIAVEEPLPVEPVVELEKELEEKEVIEQKKVIAELEPEKIEIVVEAEREEIVLEAEREEIVLESEQEEIILEQEDIFVEKVKTEKTRIAIGSIVTRKNDTLWHIAKKANVNDDVSIEQMMMGIFEANPKAFYKNNVNALKAGETLTIPEKNVILKLSKKSALSTFRKQTNVWRGQVSAKAQAQEKPVVSTDAGIKPQLELLAPVKAEIDGTAVASTKDSVDRVAELKKIAILSKEGSALKTELEKMQKELGMMQEMLVLKDKQIAALQAEKMSDASAEIDRAERATEEKAKAEEQAKAKELAKLEEKAKSEELAQTKTAENAKAEELVKVKEEEKAKAEAVKLAEEKAKAEELAKVEAAKLAKAAEVKPTVKTPVVKAIPKDVKIPKTKVKPKLRTVVQPEPEQGLLADMYNLIIAAVGVCVVLILGVWWWRRRSSDDEMDTESMFANASEISLPDSSPSDASSDELSVPSMDDTTTYNVGTVGESSFLSEFTPSDFDAFDTDQNEVDPISEADVYLAYGRYQQAEDLMRQAIEAQPERDECKLKLLEIFYANENTEGYEKYAQELVDSGKHNDQDFWTKVVEMGSELSPESALFKDQVGSKSNFDTEELDLNDSDDSESLDVVEDDSDSGSDLEKDASDEEESFDLSVFDEDDDEEKESSDAAEENTVTDSDSGLDFDLSAFAEEEEEPVVEGEEEPTAEADTVIEDTSDDNELDFDLSKFSEEEEEMLTVAEVDAVTEDTNDSNELDFDLSAFTEEEEQPTAEVDTITEDTSDNDGLDFDLSKFSEEEEEMLAVAEVDAVTEDTNDSNELDTITEDTSDNDGLDFDLDSLAESSVESSEPVTDEGELSDLNLDDVSETSLDSDIITENTSDNDGLDFDLDSLAESSVEESSEPVIDEDESFDLNLDDVSETSLDSDIELSVDAQTDDNAESLDFLLDDASSDDGETDLLSSGDSLLIENSELIEDSDEESEISLITGSADSELGVSDLTDMDEMETKIDLAKAYIDMGDNEAAKSIADEVLEKGSDEQKNAAQSILDQIN